VRPPADGFAAVARDEEPTSQPVAAYEPFVFERADAAPVTEYAAPVEYDAPPVRETFAAPDEPAFEFAFASEPVFATAPSHDVVGAGADPDPADEIAEEIAGEIGDNAIVIDLTDDIEEISPEPPAETVFDGEPMGVYTMPSFDDEPFQTAAAFEARPAAPFDEPVVSRFRPDVLVGIDANPTRRFDTHAHVEPIAPAEPALEEFFDESEIVEEFAAADAMPVAAPVVASTSAPPDVESWSDEQVAPAPVQKRDDSWTTTGLRSAWAWPSIEGVNAEPPPALVSLEEFSGTLVPPAPVRAPAPRPAAVPRPEPQPQPQLTAAAPAKPAAPAPKPAAPPLKPAASPGKPAASKPAAAAAAAKPDHMEWAELVASLRQDIERRRNQPAAAATPAAEKADIEAPAPRQPEPAPQVAEAPRTRKSTPVQDEWGFFDPQQCGFAALLAKLDEFSDGAEEKDVGQPL
jgi:hypothetical protein